MAAGLPAMAAHLGNHGHDARVWNLHAERSAGIRQDLAGDLAGVGVLAISVQWFYQLPFALRLATDARASGFRGYIVLGGFTASLWAEDLLKRHAQISGVIRGDGEGPLLVLAGACDSARTRLARVPNLVWRSARGIRRNDFSYVGGSAEIDALDFGRLDLVRHLDTHLAHGSWRAITDGSSGVDLDLSSTFYVCGGRGCSVSCATCGGGRLAHRAHSNRRTLTFRSPARIADDIQQAMTHGCSSIHACFDPVPGGPHWHGVMSELERRHIRLPMIFECFGLPDQAFIDHFAATFDGGILVISPESADERVRERSRGFFFSNASLERTLDRIVALGLYAQVFFGYLAVHGGPRELYRTCRWIRRLDSRHPRIQVMHYPYSTDPGSPLVKDPGRFGMACLLRRPVDWERELEKQEPWLGNLLRHGPASGGSASWQALSLGVEIERACRAEMPRVHARLVQDLGSRVDPFFTQIARQMLRAHPVEALARSRLGVLLAQSLGKDALGGPP